MYSYFCTCTISALIVNGGGASEGSCANGSSNSTSCMAVNLFTMESDMLRVAIGVTVVGVTFSSPWAVVWLAQQIYIAQHSHCLAISMVVLLALVSILTQHYRLSPAQACKSTCLTKRKELKEFS